jgi:hypothetical protein
MDETMTLSFWATGALTNGLGKTSAAAAGVLLCYYPALLRETNMIVAIVTFHLAQPTTLADITGTFQSTAPKYQGIAGLLRKNYWLSEDGRRAGGIYVWASRADAERIYTAEWKEMVESKYGSPPAIEYLHSPVMVDNRDGTISVAA